MNVCPLKVSLTARNACLLLSQSRLFEEPELMTRCWEVIDAQAEMALQSDGFVDIDYPTLISVLSRETLNCREIVLFEASLNWAETECERQGLECTPHNKRKVSLSWHFIVPKYLMFNYTHCYILIEFSSLFSSEFCYSCITIFHNVFFAIHLRNLLFIHCYIIIFLSY